MVVGRWLDRMREVDASLGVDNEGHQILEIRFPFKSVVFGGVALGLIVAVQWYTVDRMSESLRRTEQATEKLTETLIAMKESNENRFDDLEMHTVKIQSSLDGHTDHHPDKALQRQIDDLKEKH